MKRRMKRLAIFLLFIMMLFSLSSCSNQTKHYVMTTGGATGTYYLFGGEIASMLTANIEDVEITAQTSGGSKDNVLALHNGEAEIAFVQNDVMSYAYNGTEDFGGKPIEGFSAIGTLFPELVQIVVAKDSGIESVSDLKGKNVGIGAIGSGAYFNVIQILEAAGMTLDDINVQYLSFGESAESFQNKQLDAFFVTGPYAHSSIVDAALKREIEILSFSESEIENLQNKYSFYISDTIPAGTYEGVDEDVLCPAVSAVLVVSNKIDTETVYKLTKTLFEGKNELTNAKKVYLDPSNAILGIPTSQSDASAGITHGSIHPGALRYYIELGLLTTQP